MVVPLTDPGKLLLDGFVAFTIIVKSDALLVPLLSLITVLITVRETGGSGLSSKTLLTVQTVSCVIVNCSSRFVGHPSPVIEEKK